MPYHYKHSIKLILFLSAFSLFFSAFPLYSKELNTAEVSLGHAHSYEITITSASKKKSFRDNIDGKKKPALRNASGSTSEIDVFKKFYVSTLTDEKRKEFQKIIADYKKDRKKAGLSYSLFILGLIKELAGEFEAAIENYQKLIGLFPGAKYSYLSKERISECYLALNQKNKAIDNYLDYYKWKISEGKREEIVFRVARIYNQTLTTLDSIIEAYKQAAQRYEFTQSNTIDYLVGYFKGFHLLDAHMATLYYRRVMSEYPQGLKKFDSLLSMSLIFAYDLSDVETAKTMLKRLFEEESEYAKNYDAIQRTGRLVYGLLCQFHSPQLEAEKAMQSYKKVLEKSCGDDVANLSAYYLGYYYEHQYSVELSAASSEIKINPRATIDNYLADIKNDGIRKPLDNAVSSYMLGYLIRKDEFYAEECAFRAALLLMNNYSDTVSASLIYKSVKKNIKQMRRERDFEDLVNLKLPSSFDKTYSALYSKEKKYYESNQYKKSIQTHEEIASQSKGGPEAEYSLYTVGRIYDEDLKEYENAINAYLRFLKAFPKSSRADKVLYQIARIYETNLLDLNAAAKYYNRLIDEGRDQLWIFQAGIDLAALYSRPVFKKESEVPKILEKLREKVPMREDEVLFKLGESYEKTSKKPEKSLELFEKVVRDYPGSMYFESALDRILKVHYKESLEEINKKVILAREKKGDDMLSILQEKFEKEKFVGNFKEAMETLGEIKKMAADTEEALLIDMRSAQIQIEGLKEFEKGIEALKKLASQAAGTRAEPEILYATGKALEEQEKDYKNAVVYYEKVISMNELHSKAQMMSMFKAGIIYAINLKDYENAFKCYSLIMSKYPDEARDEKLDAKIANLLNIDLNSLQNYLKATNLYSDKEKVEKEGVSEKTGEVSIDGDRPVTSETSLKKNEGSSLFKGLYDTSLGIIDSFKSVPGRDEEGVIEEEPSWFSKASRPVYEDASWFKKRSHLSASGEYSWFQKPVDLSDIGISEPSWFKKGGLSIDRKLSDIDEETYRLRAEMELAPVKSSKTVKYSNYIENNPESKKLPIVYLYLAISYEENHDFEKAVETYKTIIADHQQYPKIAFTAYERLSALLARERREYGKANFIIGQMKEKLPAYFNQAEKLSEKVKQYQKIDENERFIRENIGEEKSLDLMYENARIYEEKLGDNPQAVTYLNKCASYISGDPEEIKYKLEAARIYSEKMNEHQLAYDELNDILERFPGCTAENEVRYKAAEIAISKLSKKETGIALLEKIKDSRKNEEVYKDAMILLQSAYKEDQVDERFSAVQSMRDVVSGLKVSADMEKAFKKLDVDKKAKSLLDMIELDEENPDNAHYMYYVARLYERESEDYDSAAKYYREFISMDLPEEKLIQGISSLGLIYETKIKKPEKAIELYREFIVKNQPENTDFLAYLQFKIGEDYELMKKRDECIAAYRKVKFYFPISRWVKTSEDRIAQILASPDKFVTLHDRMADEEDEFGTKETGLKEPKGTFEIALSTGEISLSSAEIEIAQEKDPEKKIEKLQALIDSRPEKDPKLPNYLIEIARLYEQGQKADKAAEALKRIVDEYPKFERYYDIALKLAEMYRTAQNIEEATNYYKKIVQESPQYDKTEYVRYMLGKMYVEKREYVYAIDTFRELVERYQDSLYAKKAQYEKGLVNERFMKDYDAAIADFELMADKYFDHENAPDAQFEIGWIYENAKRDYQKAKDAYQKALDRFPNTPRRREIIEAIERVTPKIPR